MNDKIILVLLLAFFVHGCQGSGHHEEKLQEAQIAIEAAEQEVARLESRNRALERTVAEANSRYENLQIQKKELVAWLGYVAKEIGPAVWAVDQYEKPTPQDIVKGAAPEELIARLNRRFQRTEFPQVSLVKVGKETAHIKISEEEKLTRQMGTQGALNYINSVVYTLFSAYGIQCVELDFAEGDHAFPGRHCPLQGNPLTSQIP